MSEWKPIETGPKDGNPVLVLMPEYDKIARLHPSWRCATAYCNYGRWELSHTGGWAEDADLWGEPTHWMPLPSPPEEVET